MDEQYRAKLVEHPPGRPTTAPPPQPPDPHHPVPPIGLYPPGSVPFALPPFIINPYSGDQATPAAAHQEPAPTINVPTTKAKPINTMTILGWEVARPHPLLWLCLALSLLALVLEVPKGSLPTLTGRHKALRSREKELSERLHLLTQLSVFLPPPLSNIVSPRHAEPSAMSLDDRLCLIPGLRFWDTNAGTQLGVGTDGDKWWSIEELGDGASVVRTKAGEDEREVWVLRTGEGQTDDKALLNALTHSLLLRDRLQAEVAHLKAIPCSTCPASPPAPLAPAQHGSQTYLIDQPHTHFSEEAQREDNERIEERRRRDKERDREVEDREREVGRREKWVVEEMRKLSDKVHNQASELELEDRITERIKAFQRQRAALGHDEQEP